MYSIEEKISVNMMSNLTFLRGARDVAPSIQFACLTTPLPASSEKPSKSDYSTTHFYKGKNTKKLSIFESA